MDSDHLSEQPCLSKACAIQSCLFDNDFKEEKCYTHIMNLYKCCSNYYELKKKEFPNKPLEELPLTTSCPKYTILVKKIDNLQKEIKKD